MTLAAVAPAIISAVAVIRRGPTRGAPQRVSGKLQIVHVCFDVIVRAFATARRGKQCPMGSRPLVPLAQSKKQRSTDCKDNDENRHPGLLSECPVCVRPV